LVIVVVISIAVAALKIGDVLTYSLVPFFLYIVCRLISRFTAYKVLFALIAVLMIRGVIVTDLILAVVELLERGISRLVVEA
jgi:hypothetical protein